MDTPDDTSKRRKTRAASKQATPAHAPSEPDDEIDSLSAQNPLREAIEAERLQLLQVHAVLKCLSEVLLYADEEADVTLHADVAGLAAKLIEESVERLDSIRLNAIIEAHERGAGYEPAGEQLDLGRGKGAVKDAGNVRYLC